MKRLALYVSLASLIAFILMILAAVGLVIETPINTKLLNDPVKLNSLKQNTPLGRLGTPNDIAPMVAFLASSAAGYITGSTFFVDGKLIRNYHEQ